MHAAPPLHLVLGLCAFARTFFMPVAVHSEARARRSGLYGCGMEIAPVLPRRLLLQLFPHPMFPATNPSAINRNTTMKLLTLLALVALSLSMTACNDREAEAVAPPASAEAGVGPGAVDAPDVISPADPAAAGAALPPAGTVIGACEGLTGQALTDCLNQAGPTSAPTMVDPTAPTDATTPPQS
ncbi:hypothetical protein ACFFGH_02835 [Lysobacter korlensis]|uniref:Secreted protein n=1 Tax=Lysobacter korlensis TaxID=553636 RepID=A0ABV6RIH3_9GAMM